MRDLLHGIFSGRHYIKAQETRVRISDGSYPERSIGPGVRYLLAIRAFFIFSFYGMKQYLTIILNHSMMR